MSNRGLLAPLSPNEEVALRRVSLGILPRTELSLRHVKRLCALGLVERTTDSLRLTPLGHQRYAALPLGRIHATFAPVEKSDGISDKQEQQ